MPSDKPQPAKPDDMGTKLFSIGFQPYGDKSFKYVVPSTSIAVIWYPSTGVIMAGHHLAKVKTFEQIKNLVDAFQGE